MPGVAERARTILVTSGKGGVGKSNLSLNLAIAARRLGHTVLLLDADLGLGNAEILAGVSVRHHLADVLAGRCPLPHAVVQGPGGIDLLAGGHGLVDLPPADGLRWRQVLAEVASYPWQLVIIDGGAGLSGPVRPQLLAARELLVVTTAEPTALADAYAVIKLVATQAPPPRLWVVVNQVATEAEGRAVYQRLASVAQRFLGVDLAWLGAVPFDPRLRTAVRRQAPLVLDAPGSPAARSVEAMARRLLGQPVPQTGGLLAFLSRLRFPRGRGGGRDATEDEPAGGSHHLG